MEDRIVDCGCLFGKRWILLQDATSSLSPNCLSLLFRRFICSSDNGEAALRPCNPEPAVWRMIVATLHPTKGFSWDDRTLSDSFFFKNKHRTPKILKEFEQFFPNLQILHVYPAHPEVPERNCSKSCHAPVFCKNTVLLLVMDLMGYDRYPCKNWVLYCNPSIVLYRPVYLPPKWLSCIWFGHEKWWLLDEQKNEGFATNAAQG